jgi:hypothetical protein
MSFEFSLRKSFVLSFRESLATSDVRSDGLSFGVSCALGGETSFGLSFRLSSERSSPRSFRASFPRRFPASFLRSSKESAERGTGSGSALVVQWSGGGMRSPKAEERRTGNDERRTKNEPSRGHRALLAVPQVAHHYPDPLPEGEGTRDPTLRCRQPFTFDFTAL